MKEDCLFCQIINGTIKAHIVFADNVCCAFLDNRPLFPGHCLLVSKDHLADLSEVSAGLIPELFANVQKIASSVEKVMQAQGTFVAINNKVSQSVPHLHVHIVPRRKGDGLKGFFWPRQKYKSEEEMADVARKLKEDLDQPTSRQSG